MFLSVEATACCFVTFCFIQVLIHIGLGAESITTHYSPSIDVNPSDLTVECDGDGNQNELNTWLNNQGGASSSDECGSVVWTNDFNSISNECGETGSVIVTFTATDDCGNQSTSTATFTIEDTTNPSIDNNPQDETVECDGDGNQAELQAWLDSNGGAGTASDIC